jgi:putative endonuclease
VVGECGNKSLGDWGELQAAAYLEGQGYQILQRNVRTPLGEIDLIARRDGVTVFVEVKTRRNRKFGYPEAAVDRSKQSRFQAAAEYILQDHPEFASNCRIDVVAIEKRTEPPEIEIRHFEHAF